LLKHLNPLSTPSGNFESFTKSRAIPKQKPYFTKEYPQIMAIPFIEDDEATTMVFIALYPLAFSRRIGIFHLELASKQA
jgi:hypothetical protein